jgi:3-oxoacyl-[acyl-carrier protein] reductase
MQRLPDRVALVTGAAGGLGRATAVRLAAEGARLCLLDRAAVSAVRSEVEALGTEAIELIADVTDSSAINAAFEQAAARFGRIDALINIAGVSSHGSSDDVTEQEWNRVLSCNLTSVFLCCKAVLPIMRSQKFGRIVNVSSVLAKNGGNPRPWIDPEEQKRAGNLAYGAAKAGMHSLTSFLAKENAHHGITVNVVAPGPIATHMTRNLPQALRNLIPVGRMGTPEDVADAVVFLAGDSAGFITGEVLDVNGGLWMD